MNPETQAVLQESHLNQLKFSAINFESYQSFVSLLSSCHLCVIQMENFFWKLPKNPNLPANVKSDQILFSVHQEIFSLSSDHYLKAW